MAHFCPPHIAPCTCCGLCSPVLRLEQRNAHEVDEWMRCNRNPQIPPEVGGIVWMHGNAPSAFLAVGASKVLSKYRWLLPTYAPGVWGMSEEGGPCSAEVRASAGGCASINVNIDSLRVAAVPGGATQQ